MISEKKNSKFATKSNDCSKSWGHYTWEIGESEGSETGFATEALPFHQMKISEEVDKTWLSTVKRIEHVLVSIVLFYKVNLILLFSVYNIRNSLGSILILKISFTF